MKYLMKFNQLNEEIDYKDIDISDLEGDTYKGYSYLYSKTPINIKDIKRKEVITTQLSNRPEANNDIGNYIYLIKTKNPLDIRRKGFEFSIDDGDIFDTKPKESTKFSGYIKKEFITRETVVYIKTKDIIKFKLIGGFSKFDKNIPNKRDIKLSEDASSFLSTYMTGRILHNKLTPSIENELEKFKLNKTIKLYKGIEQVQLEHHTSQKDNYKVGDILLFEYPFFSSWSTNFLLAKRFIDEYPSSTPFVIEYTTLPEDILVDTRLLPEQYFISNQREVILKKNREYKIKIIWKGDFNI